MAKLALDIGPAARILWGSAAAPTTLLYMDTTKISPPLRESPILQALREYKEKWGREHAASHEATPPRAAHSADYLDRFLAAATPQAKLRKESK